MTCRRFKPAVVIILWCALCSGCDTLENPDPNGSETRLNVHWLEAYRKSGAVSDTESSQSIDLGDVPWGRDFVFAVSRTGPFPVRNISVRLQSESPGISIVPDSLPDLYPDEATSEAASFRMNLEHGRRIFGAGFDLLQEKGDHQIRLILSGEVLPDRGAPIAVTQTVDLQFTALVMEMEVTDDYGLVKPSGSVLGGGTPGFVIKVTPVGPVVVRNTGNIPMDIGFRLNGQNSYRERLVAPGDTFRVAAGKRGRLRYGLDRAASDPTRFRLYPGNVGYLYLDPDEVDETEVVQ